MASDHDDEEDEDEDEEMGSEDDSDLEDEEDSDEEGSAKKTAPTKSILKTPGVGKANKSVSLPGSALVRMFAKHFDVSCFDPGTRKANVK